MVSLLEACDFGVASGEESSHLGVQRGHVSVHLGRPLRLFNVVSLLLSLTSRALVGSLALGRVGLGFVCLVVHA